MTGLDWSFAILSIGSIAAMTAIFFLVDEWLDVRAYRREVEQRQGGTR